MHSSERSDAAAEVTHQVRPLLPETAAVRPRAGGLRLRRFAERLHGGAERSACRRTSRPQRVVAAPDVRGPVRLGPRDATLALGTAGLFDVLGDAAVAKVLRDTAPDAARPPESDYRQSPVFRGDRQRRWGPAADAPGGSSGGRPKRARPGRVG